MNRATREPAPLSRLDALTDIVGRSIAWLVLVMMVVQFTIVVMRYVFSVHSVAMQESVMAMHAMVFMLGAAYTLKHDGHVRVDIFYRRLSPRGRAWVDLGGTLFLLMPVVLFIAFTSWHYVLSSWAILERTSDGNLPIVFLIKSLILLMMTLLLLQGIAQIIRQILILHGRLPAEPLHEHEEVL
ncbi:hypothetical protein L861_07745 [Litchfieldella anticariensis FP35 = DSM 16096]|uniref:TRAP transporter small permease protein n=1 Tax=Litchfieldella anticariensis (strain DSM 16096 / CECT 5854 / CIP 108499 / LMG 22089 / FP35) TaxID=1121939 RepID=S2KX89_LITA3|nr:TRAP transporter small permease subunit [Halomonas anticariensis]EPC00049.1 hypothetical protein L861_07745 [Halomonas anticariensis FP35 = DSM 16096]